MIWTWHFHHGNFFQFWIFAVVIPVRVGWRQERLDWSLIVMCRMFLDLTWPHLTWRMLVFGGLAAYRHLLCRSSTALPSLPHLRLCRTQADSFTDNTGRIRPEPVRTKRTEYVRAVFYVGLGEETRSEEFILFTSATTWLLYSPMISHPRVSGPFPWLMAWECLPFQQCEIDYL